MTPETLSSLRDALSSMERMERRLEGVRDRLAEVRDRARGFADTVRQGFQDFLDISGAFEEGVDISQFFTEQLAAAQQFADILEALRRQGISRALLAEIASAGPAAVPFAQALLQQGPSVIATVSQQFDAIREIAESTSRSLTREFFGQRIDELKERLTAIRETIAATRETIRELLKTLIQQLREMEKAEEVKGLAHGGIVTRPTVALIGEAGPEAVVPLDRGFGGVVVNVTVQGSVVTEAELARTIERRLDLVLQRQGRILGGSVRR